MLTLLPTKNQWKQWSLPSKLTAIGTFLAIISIAITLIFEFIYSKEYIIVDNTKKSIEYLDIAKQNFKRNDTLRMLNFAMLAYEKDISITTIEYLAFSFFINGKIDSCLIICYDNENKFTKFGKWIFASSLLENPV